MNKFNEKMQSFNESASVLQFGTLSPQNGRWSSLRDGFLVGSNPNQSHISALLSCSSPAHHRRRAHTPTARPRARLSSLRSPQLSGPPPATNQPSPPTRPHRSHQLPTSGRPQPLSAAPCPAPIIHIQMCTRNHTRRLSAPNVSTCRSRTHLPQPPCARLVAMSEELSHSHLQSRKRSSTPRRRRPARQITLANRAHLAASPHVPSCVTARCHGRAPAQATLPSAAPRAPAAPPRRGRPATGPSSPRQILVVSFRSWSTSVLDNPSSTTANPFLQKLGIVKLC